MLRMSVYTWPSDVSAGSWYVGMPCWRMHCAASCSLARRASLASPAAPVAARPGRPDTLGTPEAAGAWESHAASAPIAMTPVANADRSLVFTGTSPRTDWSKVYLPASDITATAHVGPMSSRPAHNVGMRVLVVEDHVKLAERIGEGLRDAGMAVDVVHDGGAALASAGHTAYDVIVLDRDLPVVHGDQVCRSLAASAGARILMLT